MLSFLYLLYAILLCFDFLYSLVVKKNITTRLLLVLLFLSILTEAITASTNFEDYFYYACFSPVEYGLISLILVFQFGNRGMRMVLCSSIVLFLLTCIILINNQKNDYPSIITAIENVIIIIWCLLSFYKLEPLPDKSILQRSVFWITLGFFIYTLGTFSANVVYNYWLSTKDAYAEPFHKYINVLFNIALYILIGKGLILNQWEEKST